MDNIRGAKPVSTKRRRQIVLTVRVDPVERAVILANADIVSASVAGYMRGAALQKRRHAKVPGWARTLVAEIGRAVYEADRQRTGQSPDWPKAFDAVIASLRALSQLIVIGDPDDY